MHNSKKHTIFAIQLKTNKTYKIMGTIKENERTINKLENLRWNFYDELKKTLSELDLDNINVEITDEYGNKIKITKIQKGIITVDNDEEFEFNILDWEERMQLIDYLSDLLDDEE